MSTELLRFTIFRATFFRRFCPNGPICPCQCGCGCFDETSGRIAQTGMITLFLFNISLFQYTVPIFYSVFFSCHDTTTTIFDVLFLTYYLLLYSNLLNLLNVALKMNYRDQKFATTKILTTAILNKLTRCFYLFYLYVWNVLSISGIQKTNLFATKFTGHPVFILFWLLAWRH